MAEVTSIGTDLRQRAGRGDSGAESHWQLLRDAPDLETASKSWLALQGRMLGRETSGVVVLLDADGQPRPTATLPADRPADTSLAKLAELALSEKKGVAGIAAGGSAAVAYPIIVGERAVGAAAFASGSEPAQAMRQLQWGIAVLRDRALRGALEESEQHGRQGGAVLALMAVVLDEEKFVAASLAAATHLALNFGCDRVAIGMLRRGAAKVAAVSHSASFGKQMALVRHLGSAMDEAIDQRAVVLHPPHAGDVPLATRAHADLAREGGAGQVCTIPMLVKDRFLGAATFERPAERPFAPEEVTTLSAAVAALGPVLEARRLNDRHILLKIWDAFTGVLKRLFGPRHAGLKATAAAIVLVAAFLSLARAPYDVTADAELEGLQRRAVVAPLDGFIMSAPVRAGDRVEEGDVLAALDDRDLTLERLRWSTERQQRQLEYDRAFAARDRSALAVARAQIDAAEAQMRLVDEQLSRLQLRAPFPALVIAGDLSQSIGGAVGRGATLFELAPLDAYRVNIAVDQTQIGDIAVGQTGSVLFSAIPETPFPFVVEKVTPVAEARAGRTVFRVEGRVTGAPERLRPGMEGIARVAIEERHLIWIWARSFLDWARIATWQWLR